MAINGLRIDDDRIDGIFNILDAGAGVPVLFVRDGLVDARHLVLDDPRPTLATVRVRPGATIAELALLEGWLGAGAADQLRATP